MLLMVVLSDFNPRSPCGERRCFRVIDGGFKRFQSTLPVRGATETVRFEWTYKSISIHAPRAGSDLEIGLSDTATDISIHAPRAGSDPASRHGIIRSTNFNPRSPCGERPISPCIPCSPLDFNPRSPCGERPPPWSCLSGQYTYFNPRSPCGERRDAAPHYCIYRYFNPRSPCGERLITTTDGVKATVFQSTLPVRGATNCICGITPAIPAFQSTLPVRGATERLPLPLPVKGISIHAPRAGSDFDVLPFGAADGISIHAPRAGSDPSPPEPPPP